MKLWSWVLLVLTLVAAAGMWSLMIYAGLPAGLGGLWALFLGSFVLVKMVTMLLIPVAGLMAVLAFTRSAPPEAMKVFGAGALGLGLLVAAFDDFNIWQAVQMTHVTNPQIYAPGLAESLMPVTLGLLCAFLASLAAKPKT